jgi:hypothetical protein
MSWPASVPKQQRKITAASPLTPHDALTSMPAFSMLAALQKGK